MDKFIHQSDQGETHIYEKFKKGLNFIIFHVSYAESEKINKKYEIPIFFFYFPKWSILRKTAY